jgi:hypothetical protein
MVPPRRFAPLALLLAGSTFGCSKTYVPNTDVEDTDANRDVIEFCEVYRHAVERKDVATLLTLASAEYYEDGGNIDASDDIDFAGLREYLIDKFETGVSGIRYEIRYRRITDNEEAIWVDYTFSGSFRVPTEDGEKWRSVVEENRLEIVRDGETFKIVAGM